MEEKNVSQKCTATRVVGNGNWENYMWPHNIDKNAKTGAQTQQPREHGCQNFSLNVSGNNYGNCVGNNLSGVSGVTINYK